MAVVTSPSLRLKIESANFGGLDITDKAIAQWPKENYLQIAFDFRAVSDPLSYMGKSISCLYRWDNERRILVCHEKDEYRIQEGDIRNSRTRSAYHETITAPSAPSSSRIQIVAVVWGLAGINKSSVLEELYNKVNTDVTFNSSLFGGDTWRNNVKTGTIFYEVKGGDGTILQFSGKEGSTVHWRVT